MCYDYLLWRNCVVCAAISLLNHFCPLLWLGHAAWYIYVFFPVFPSFDIKLFLSRRFFSGLNLFLKSAWIELCFDFIVSVGSWNSVSSSERTECRSGIHTKKNVKRKIAECPYKTRRKKMPKFVNTGIDQETENHLEIVFWRYNKTFFYCFQSGNE